VGEEQEVNLQGEEKGGNGKGQGSLAAFCQGNKEKKGPEGGELKSLSTDGRAAKKHLWESRLGDGERKRLMRKKRR